MKNLLTILILLCLTLSLNAQDKVMKEKAQTAELSKKVAEAFKNNQISQAFEALQPHWPLPQYEIGLLEEKTVEQLDRIKDRFGTAIDIQKINEESIQDFAIRETYFVRYQNTPIRLVFIYYKNNDGWIVNAFTWDAAFQNEFE